MSKYLVATLAIYAIVEAKDEADARLKGGAALYELYADVRARHGGEVPIVIRTIRLATPDEIDLWDAHQANVARQAKETEL